MKKIISILLVLVMALSLAVTVSATEDPVEWSLSEDGKTLSDGTNEYTKYPLSYSESFFPDLAYVFEYAITDNDFTELDVIVPMKTGDIIALRDTYGWESEEIFVTEKGRSILDSFYGGSYSFARFYNDVVTFGGYADIPLDFLNELDRFSGETVELDVKEIGDWDYCTLYVYDSTDTMEHIHGEIYFNEDSYYYINYDALDNSYFDSDGFFSYRSGTVTALKLDSEKISVFNEATSNLEDRYTKYKKIGSDEVDEIFDMDVGILDEASAKVVFWVFSVITGFAIPLIFGILGIIFALSKKPGKNKKWLMLTATSVLWMAVSAAIIVIIII